MDPAFWTSRWAEGKLGFHEGKPNTFLERHAAKLAGTRVLVPLCGKAEDLAYLAARGHEVVGIELVEDAVAAFFTEHSLAPAIERRGAIVVYSAGTITLIAGDVFTVTREDVGAIDAVYDRAALVALPANLRRRYIEHLQTLVAPATSGLLVTLDYPQDKFEGPPFAVGDAEVYAHYRTVELLEERPATSGRIGESGLPAVERCYVVRL